MCHIIGVNSMPDCVTHYLFGRKILKLFPNEIKTAVDADKDAYLWGLQGPDLLYFSEMVRSQALPLKVGIELHKADSNIVFSELLQYIIYHKRDPDYKHLCAYLYGFVCHYALDKTCHPFVNYFSTASHGEAFAHRHGMHALIESDIDSLMYKKITGSTISSVKIETYYKRKGSFQLPISNLYVYLAKRITGKVLELRQALKSFSSYITFTNATYGPSGQVFYAFAKPIELILNKNGAVTNYIKHNNILRDSLNIKGKEWYNPRHPEQKSNATFPELFEASRIEAITLAKKCYTMLSHDRIDSFCLTENFDNGTLYV